MNYKRLLVGILLFPIVIPIFILKVILFLLISSMFGLEYVFTGKYNKDDSGW